MASAIKFGEIPELTGRFSSVLLVPKPDIGADVHMSPNIDIFIIVAVVFLMVS